MDRRRTGKVISDLDLILTLWEEGGGAVVGDAGEQ
jgi:hypothetical protein